MSKKDVTYDYTDSFSRSDKTGSPTKKEFYTILNAYDEHISDEDNDYAEKVWKKFKLENMGQITMIYI